MTNNSDRKLSITEESDFSSLLELMVPMHNQPEYAWLPELFSTIGYKSFIRLCKFAGGERIQIPTLSELSTAIEAMDWYYKVWISKTQSVTDIPPDLHRLVEVIARTYDSSDN